MARGVPRRHNASMGSVESAGSATGRPTRRPLPWLASLGLAILAAPFGLMASFGVLVGCTSEERVESSAPHDQATCDALGRAGQWGWLGWTLIVTPPIVVFVVTRVFPRRAAPAALGIAAVVYLAVWIVLNRSVSS